MAFLEGLLGGGGGDPLDLYGDLFTDKQKAALRDREMGQGLLRMAGAFAKAAQPTLLPGGGIGSAIGSAAAAMGAGGDEATERILKGMQTSEAVRASQQKRALNAKISPILLRMLEQQNGLPSGSLAPAAAAAPATPAAPDTPVVATPPEAGPAGLPPRFGLGPQPDRSQYGFPVPPTAAGPMPPAPAGGRITPADYGVPDGGAGAGLLSPPDELVAQSAPEDGLLARMQRMAAMQQGGGGGSGLPFQLASAAIPGAGGDDAAGSGGAAADYGVNYLQKELGLAPHQARGAVRWMENVESGLKPDIVNPTSGAYGIAQHLGPRKQALMQKYGASPSFQNQLAFIADELRGPEVAALRSLQNTKTENEAFRAWGRNFERPSAAEYARATGEGFSGGGAAPGGGGAASAPGAGAAPSSGTIPGLGMTPQGLAALNALTEMGGLGEPFKSLLETYYKSPGYLGEKARTEAQATKDVEFKMGPQIKKAETIAELEAQIQLKPKLEAAIAWAKIDPAIDEAQRKADIDRYSKMLEQLRGAGLEPTDVTVTFPGEDTPRKITINKAQLPALTSGKGIPELGIPPMSGVKLGEPVHNQEQLEQQKYDMKFLEEKRQTAEGSRQAIMAANDTRALIEKGVVAGSYADERTRLLKLGQLLNLTGKDDNDRIRNTEAYIATLGRNLKEGLKGLGPPVSNVDLGIAEKIAGGQNLTTAGLQELMRIQEKYHRLNLQDYDKLLKSAPASRYDKSVKEPPTFGAPVADGPNGPIWYNGRAWVPM